MRGATADGFVFADEVLTDEFRKLGIVRHAVVHRLFSGMLTDSRHHDRGEAAEGHLWSETRDTRHGDILDR